MGDWEKRTWKWWKERRYHDHSCPCQSSHDCLTLSRQWLVRSKTINIVASTLLHLFVHTIPVSEIKCEVDCPKAANQWPWCESLWAKFVWSCWDLMLNSKEYRGGQWGIGFCWTLMMFHFQTLDALSTLQTANWTQQIWVIGQKCQYYVSTLSLFTLPCSSFELLKT